MIRHPAIVLVALVCAAPALGADPNAGKNTFRQQCALCHSAEPGDNGGAQGPNLNGVFGRHAASDPRFGYTKALQRSSLTWDAATLDRFLAAPTTVVPGSAMVVAVPNDTDRANLIAYFQGVQEGTFKAAPPRQFTPPPGIQTNTGPAKGEADWKKDEPGRVHRIDVNSLPPPFDSPSATNFPKLIDRPPDAKLRVPPGFKVDVFATNLEGARAMKLAPNGDVFLTETRSGFVKVLRPAADGATAASVTTFAQGLNLPFGIAFYPAKAPRWLYVAETNRVVRYAYKVGDQQASGLPEIVVPELSPVGTGGHFTRDIAFSPDGKRMFVSVGSASNVAEEMPKKTPREIEAWQAQHGLGATWGPEEKRADVLVFEVGTNKPGKVFATGIRNCVGLTIQPATDDLWCTTNERDMLGDDLVPDYSTRVLEGHYYGWPWYYMGKYEDPRLKGDRPDLAGKATVPDVPYQAHSAALNLVFYTATSGKSAFPKEYVGDGFAVMHGSWNRAFRTGHKVVRVRMKNNVPTGEYDDFLVGFIADDGDAWARPVGAVVAGDGSLLISEDGNNTIYRISYSHSSAAPSLPETITIPGEKIFPESLTSTSDGSVIIGSIGQKAIYRAKPGAATADVWIPSGKDGLNGVFGVFADNKANTLYACSNAFGPPTAASTGNATLYAFDLKTGATKAHYVFPSEHGACNDIAVDAAGNIYATDTNNMEVVRLKKGGSALEVWAGNGSFGPKIPPGPPVPNGPRPGVLDGISVLGSRVVVNTLGTSKLFSVPIKADGTAGPVAEVKLDREISRPDGMRSFGESDVLIVEGGNGGRLSRIALSGDTGKVTTLKEGYPDGPVAVTLVGTTAYVLEGQLAALMGGPAAGGENAPQPKPFKATAVQVGKP